MFRFCELLFLVVISVGVIDNCSRFVGRFTKETEHYMFCFILVVYAGRAYCFLFFLFPDFV
jgi:hypothetical protein